MLWTVDPASSQPLFEQLAAQVRRAIADGDLHHGDRLASAKQVAASLDINLHTVLRAYQLLRDEGLIDLRRGRGAVVIAQDAGQLQLRSLVDQVVEAGRRLGLDGDQVAALIRERS